MKGEPIPPSSGFSYLARSFRQTLPFIIGALRLLADSYADSYLPSTDNTTADTQSLPNGGGSHSVDEVMTAGREERVTEVTAAKEEAARTRGAAELNAQGFGLYADFRPVVDGWGKRAEVRCERILSLRKAKKTSPESPPQRRSGGEVRGEEHGSNAGKVSVQGAADGNSIGNGEGDARPSKKVKHMTVEEYEATLDEDAAFLEEMFKEDL